MSWIKFLRVLTLLVGISTTAEATNAPNPTIHAMSEAYAPYRISLSYLRAGESELGELSLERFIEKWQQVISRIATTPAAPFNEDPQFSASLADILKAAKDGQTSLLRGDVKGAVAHLEPIRTIVADIRRRNGVQTLNDCIDDISATMRVLQSLRESRLDLSNPVQVKQASEALSALAPTIDRCGQQPPANNREQFERLLQQASSSVATAREALAGQDAERLIRIIRELVSIDHILFQEFD